MKIHVRGKVYDSVDVSRLTLADRLRMPAATGYTGEDLEALQASFQAMTPEQRKRSEHLIVFLALLVWLARTAAGERLTLEEACDVPPDEIHVELEPSDEKAAAAEADPRRAATASGRAVAKAPADRQRKKTSKKPSSDGS